MKYRQKRRNKRERENEKENKEKGKDKMLSARDRRLYILSEALGIHR